MNKWRSSLVLRIALPFALLMILTMGALALYLSTFIQNSYLEILRGTLHAETRLVADHMAVLMQPNPTDNTAIEEKTKSYADLLGVRVTIIDPKGNVLGESFTNPQEMENHLGRPEVQRALQKTASAEIRYSDTLGAETLYSAAPIQDGDRIIGIARLAISLDKIHQNESGLLNAVLVATAIATAIGIVLAFLIASYTIHPITELTEAARQIADGRRETIPSTTRMDEVGQLHQAIQLMAQRQQQQITELRTERGRLEAVLNNMTNGVIIVNLEGNVQLANPAALRLFNVVEEGTLQKSLIEFGRQHQFVEIWRKCLETGEQQTVTLETAPERQFVQATATPLEGPLPGMTLLVFQDLTRLRRLETVRRDFVSNVSHELHTPLASLKALVETLDEGALDDPPAAHRFLQKMNTEIDNLTQIVHELLELSRIESNRVPLQRVPVSPCELAGPAIERMQLQAERAGLTLSMDCPGSLPIVRADPVRIQQVLVNMIHNAIKFTPPGGEISIYAKAAPDEVIFAIHDTGEGIPEEVIPRIFERFYKADRARSGRGTGLGLSIARNIVQAHGGRIWVESKVGEGSTFYFSLPMA
jgi:two-component system, OmpR family, phosphate regulon sensor histidine kinase PhoR